METKITFLPFDALTVHGLYDIMVLRQIVFVIEQDCPYLDADGKDKNAIHLLMHSGETLIGYTRILDKGTTYKEYGSIGRVVIHPEFRKKALGSKLMIKSIQKYYQLFQNTPLKISAQEHLEKFYSALGFNPTGEQYMEDGIPHIGMVHHI